MTGFRENDLNEKLRNIPVYFKLVVCAVVDLGIQCQGVKCGTLVLPQISIYLAKHLRNTQLCFSSTRFPEHLHYVLSQTRHKVFPSAS